MDFDELKPLFGIAGGVLGFIDYLIYARSVQRGRTKPNAATWIGTSAVWFVALISYFLVGARDTLWFVIASTAGSFLVALLTVRYGVKWRRSDFVCLASAVGVGALGLLTESPVIALCAAMAVDFLALFPTVAKTWIHPDWEEPFPWIVTVVASVLTVMAVALPWEAEIAAYPVYLLIMNSVVLALIYRPRVSGFPSCLYSAPNRRGVVPLRKRSTVMAGEGLALIHTVDMCDTCFYARRMGTMIQIRNVPDALHRRLKSRAALAGMSLSDYLLSEIRQVAERPTLDELRARLHSRTETASSIAAADGVRAERDRV